jgi:hypothetical protein
MALVISSKNKRLLCVSDAFLHPIHLQRMEWHSIFDLAPEALGGTRQKLLEMASDGRMQVMAFHFAFPGLGSVAKKGAAWTWRPADIATSA